MLISNNLVSFVRNPSVQPKRKLMPIFETFVKRQQKLRGELPDVYVYDNIPHPLRVQIVQIMMEILGDNLRETNSFGSVTQVKDAYQAIVKMLRKEIGVFHLPPSDRHQNDLIKELADYLLNESDAEHVLSAVELICRFVEHVASQPDYRGWENAEEASKNVIEEINSRLKEHGLGYEYDGEIIRIDTELIHAEAVKPALGLLRNAKFSGAEQEFMNAYSHYRKGNNKEALNDALKAFESTMKSIYEKRKWPYTKTDPAFKLIKVAFDNGLVPSFWENHFSGLRTTLEAGVPTARNKLSGHGQGATPVEVPSHFVAYILQLTASTIVFLVKAEEALP
jgi:hypothetical protein